MHSTQIIRPARTTVDAPEPSDQWTLGIDPGYCVAMAPRADGKTPNRALRVSDDLWARFGAACDALEISRSDELRLHMVAVVEEFERKQQRKARDAAAAAARD